MERIYTEKDEEAAAFNLIEIIHNAQLGVSTNPDIEIPGIGFRSAYLSFLALEEYSGTMSADQFKTYYGTLLGGFVGISMNNYDKEEVKTILVTSIYALSNILENIGE